MEIIIIVLVVGLSVYLFMKNKEDNKAKRPKKKVNKKTSTSQREANDDK